MRFHGRRVKPMHKVLVTMARVLSWLMWCQPSGREDKPKEASPYAKILEEEGWLRYFKRGATIIDELSTVRPDGARKLDITAYRGERVAYVGGGAPPGSSNDLIMDNGFYLRIVNTQGKDLRPRSVLWEILVCGEVLQVFAENKLIVLELDFFPF